MKNFHLISSFAIYALMIIGCFNSIKAQQYEWISDDFPGSRFLDIFEINGKYYGAVSNGAKIDFDPNTIYQLSIYEIEFIHSGEPGISLHIVATIPFPENFATNAIDYIEDTKNWIIVQSSVISDGLQKYRVALYDENFNFITSTSKDTFGYPIPCHIDTYNGKTYILGSIQGPPMDELLFMEYSHSNSDFLPPIEIKQSDPRSMFFVTDMKVDQMTGNMLVFYYNGIAILDSTLHQVKTFDHEQILTSDHGHLISVGDYYYSHGARDQSWDVGLRKLVFHKYDTLFNILFADTFGINDQDNYPFLTRSIDHRDNEFLVGGHLDGPFNSNNFNTDIKKFYMAKYDDEMHQLWYKEYGGDREYVLFGLKLLKDGSSLAYGTIYDSLDGFRYAYIMHVDANGEILTSTIMPSEPQSSVQILNPGDETLRILNPLNTQARIELYDIQGCHLLTREIYSTELEINTEDLPVGLYPYVLIRDGLVIGSGKWIKAK